jgi:molybdopterin synthase catalytic subunit
MFQLSTAPLDLARLRQAASHPHAGAIVTFEGNVRDHHEGRAVLRLEYEAHGAVAEKEGRRVVEEAVERFGLDFAEAVHRTGELAIEEAAVVVVVSAPHRAEAFEACRYIIDEIKHRVPIWKKEYYEDGTSGWVGCEGCAQAHRHTH